MGVAWAWRGRGVGVAWAWRGVGVAWAWRGRGVGVAWACVHIDENRDINVDVGACGRVEL